MSLENIHPVVVKRLEAQLPPHAQLILGLSRSESTSELHAFYRGETKKFNLNKTSVNLVTGENAEVYADEGTPLVQVVQSYLDKYQLYALNGVDYSQNTADLVAFEGKEKIQYVLPISFDSITLTGEMVINIKNRLLYERPKDPATADVTAAQVTLAIASKIFEGDQHNRIFSGNQLSTSLASRLNNYLNQLPLEIRFTNDEIVQAKVLKVAHDGISSVALVKTLDNFIFALRYNTDAWDAPFSVVDLVLPATDYGRLSVR